MRSKTLCAVLGILFAASLFVGSDLYAKQSGGGSRSGSSGRGSPSRGSPSPSKSQTTPSRDYGNTAKPDSGKTPGYGNTANQPPGNTKQTPSGYGNTATSPQSKGGATGLDQSKATPLQNKMNKSFSKQESAKAYEDYKAQQGKFQMNSNSGSYKPSGRETSTITSIQSSSSYSSTDYYARRNVFYGSYGWSPPVYIYRSYNSFGIWDAMILWFMLDHINEAQYANMYYHHRDDPGMLQFKKEAERLSAENADLKAKVAKMDESAKALEQQGVKQDPSYMPPDTAGIALAAGIGGTGAPKSKGFPWTWVVVIAVVVLIGLFFMRRRT